VVLEVVKEGDVFTSRAGVDSNSSILILDAALCAPDFLSGVGSFPPMPSSEDSHWLIAVSVRPFD
jgi:hypothetical protein